MKTYIYEDKNKGFIFKEFDESFTKSDQYKKYIKALYDPYENIDVFKKAMNIINPNIDIADAILDREYYSGLVLKNPYILCGLSEIYTIDTKEDCEYLLSLPYKKDNYFFIRDKERMELIRDYIIESEKFSDVIDKKIEDDSFSTVRMFMSFKCPELLIGLYFKNVKGDVEYVINFS